MEIFLNESDRKTKFDQMLHTLFVKCFYIYTINL